MKKIGFVITVMIFLFTIHLEIKAQELEYGKPEELKGLKKVFIDTKADIKNRERIVSEIEKSNVGLEIVDNPDDSEIYLVFEGGKGEVVSGTTTTPIYGTDSSITTVNRKKVSIGTGFVFIKGKSKNVPRVLMNFESSQDIIGEKKPAAKFAKEFIKAYKKANEIKN